MAVSLPSVWREMAAVLGLFAMLLGAVVTIMPVPPDALAIVAGELTVLCGGKAGAPGDHDPGQAPDHHHVCPCCLTQQVNWAAIVPPPVGLADPVISDVDLPIIGRAAPAILQPYGNSRPRAPPFAA